MTAYELISNLSDKYKWKEDVLSLIQTHPEINKRQQFNFAYEVLSLEPIKLLNNYDWRGIINNLKHKENPKFVKRENKPEPKPVIFDLLEGLNRNTKWKADAIAFAEKEIEHIKMLNIDTLAKFTNIQGLRTELPQYNWDTIKYNFTRKEKWDNSNVSETVKVPEEIVTEEEPHCDVVILTKSGRYTYFGKLDENNCRTGRGRTVSPDGMTSYDGEYLDDRRNAFGVCYYNNGSINYVGNWTDNSRNGGGVGYRLSDGTMHAGKWDNNTPDGYGARFDRNGNLIDVSNYENGVRTGKSVSFDENGNIVVSVYENGEKISEFLVDAEV